MHAKPYAMTLSVSSQAKMVVQTKLSRRSSAASSELRSRRGTSKARHNEEATMAKMMNWSNRSCSTSH